MLTLLLALLLARSPAVEVPRDWRPFVAGAAVVAMARDLREVRDLGRLAWLESRHDPDAVSVKGCVGLFQQDVRYSPIPTSAYRLRTDPIHAARVAVLVYRQMRAVCGVLWYRCYSRGIAGARRQS